MQGKRIDFWSYVRGAVFGSAETQRMIKDIELEQNTPKCKYCGHGSTVKFGTHKGIQRWWCKLCKRKFVDNNALFKMKNPVDEVSLAMSMYYGGASLDNIIDTLQQHYGKTLTDAGVYNWINRFSKLATERANFYKPEVGDTWIADETVLKIGGKNVWFWDIIDTDTRFLLASHISETRTINDAKRLMELAEKRAGKAPETIMTDRLAAYFDGIERAFGSETEHIAVSPFEEGSQTNFIERFHETLKSRTKAMHSMRKTETTQTILDGWLVYYNFFRPHEALKNRTPAQVAGIEFPYRNWTDIVQSENYNMKLKEAHLLDVRQSPIRLYNKTDGKRKTAHKKGSKAESKLTIIRE